MWQTLINIVKNAFYKKTEILVVPKPEYKEVIDMGGFNEEIPAETIHTLQEVTEEPKNMFTTEDKAWLVSFDTLGLDVSQVETHSTNMGISIFPWSKEEVVSRFQLGVGITMDGDQGPNTNAAMDSQKEYPKEINWWSGELSHIRSFGGNKPWRIDSDGLIETTEEIRTADIQPAAQMVINNYKKYVEYWEGYEAILYTTILTESSGKISAERYEPHIDDSSYGLVQILMGTANHLGFDGTSEELMDPAENIKWGYYLIESKKANTRLDPILVAATYNAGGVYPSGGNPWGMRCYGHHLNRFAANYNAIVKALN